MQTEALLTDFQKTVNVQTFLSAYCTVFHFSLITLAKCEPKLTKVLQKVFLFKYKKYESQTVLNTG